MSIPLDGMAAAQIGRHPASRGHQIGVLDFGAVGDGVTDDTQAVVKALHYAAGCENTVVVIGPAGRDPLTAGGGPPRPCSSLSWKAVQRNPRPWSGMERVGIGFDEMGWHSMGWDGMGCDGMGWDGMVCYVQFRPVEHVCAYMA